MAAWLTSGRGGIAAVECGRGSCEIRGGGTRRTRGDGLVVPASTMSLLLLLLLLNDSASCWPSVSCMMAADHGVRTSVAPVQWATARTDMHSRAVRVSALMHSPVWSPLAQASHSQRGWTTPTERQARLAILLAASCPSSRSTVVSFLWVAISTTGCLRLLLRLLDGSRRRLWVRPPSARRRCGRCDGDPRLPRREGATRLRAYCM